MCLLTYISEGVSPDLRALEYGALWNQDGHGFAVVTGDRIITHHGFDPSKVIDRFEDVRSRHMDGPAIFHSRLRTHGIDGKFNLHPFKVGNDPRTVMGHNGIFPMSAQPRIGDIRSDTRIIADRLRNNPFGHLSTKKARKRFGRWMGSGNKVAILTVDPDYSRHGYIINERMGDWVDGIWYSNDGYKPGYGSRDVSRLWWEDADDWYQGSRTYATGDDTPPWQSAFRSDCCVCLSTATVNNVNMTCEFCGCCNDCEEPALDCMCYMPEHTAYLNTGQSSQPQVLGHTTTKAKQLLLNGKPIETATIVKVALEGGVVES